MEKRLEHKIKEAFQKKDQNFIYKNKEKLWTTISGRLNRRSGVAPFWRIAAVILALLSFGVVFGSAIIIQNNSNNRIVLENRNQFLLQTIDSLLLVKPEIIVETKWREKEKTVYRDVVLNVPDDSISKAKIELLETENSGLRNQLLNTKSTLTETKNNLDLALAKLADLNELENKTAETETSKFKLKTEMVKEQMQPVKTDANPKMKFKILKIQNDNIKFDTNSTLLKKQP